MGNSYLFLKTLFNKKKSKDPEETERIFRTKYNAFKELLSSNSELLKMITELEHKLEGDEIFGMAFIKSQTARILFHCIKMVKSFESLSGSPQTDLNAVVSKVGQNISNIMDTRRGVDVKEYVLDYSKINHEMIDIVGGKNANLGEMFSKVNLPIPKGFAITTKAYDDFVNLTGIGDEIDKAKMCIEINDPSTLVRQSEIIQALFINTEIPFDIAQAILTAYDTIVCQNMKSTKDTFVSLRSSAIGEDGDLSFAGQYLTVLNVNRDKLLFNYKLILASLFTPRAMMYRLQKGVSVDNVAMSVACLQMINSVSSGVMYTRHPFDFHNDDILINSIWGLGAYVVDGVVEPDRFQVNKSEPLTIISQHCTKKEKQLVSKDHGGVIETPVPENMQSQLSLSKEVVLKLSKYGKTLEEHYRSPQDVEWALNSHGELVILQTRPLKVQYGPNKPSIAKNFNGHDILCNSGEIASQGVGFGKVYIINNDADLSSIPDNSILIAHHSSPKFMLVMNKVKAIIAESGSVTGHMASLVREFRVPCLLNVHNATSIFKNYDEITVDCYTGVIYSGHVQELTSLQFDKNFFMKETPVYSVLSKVSKEIIPLHLLDPKSNDFNPRQCKTIHDIMRYIHEKSYGEMFKINDFNSENNFAVKLDCKLPIDLYLIDVGGGFLRKNPNDRSITLDEIHSIPFLALLNGMNCNKLNMSSPRPVHLKGLFSVMGQQLISSNNISERFGEKSYAIISDKYLNFSSRVGYHYSILDAYCGQTVNKNYITFEFKGGAADETRRIRRVRAISIILDKLGFIVEVLNDRVTSRLQKEKLEIIQNTLDQLGRLLIFTRQMDMLMTTERSIEHMVTCFFDENYSFCKE